MPATTKNKLSVTTPSDLEIVMTRDFDAPRRLVWDALTKPELIKRWLFMPAGWAMTVCEEDVRVGGSFRWEWAGPDGNTAMIMRGIYREVVPPERSVRTESFIMGCNELGEQLAKIVLTEDASRKRTTVTITVLYPTKEARDGMICSGMEHGVGVGYDNLEAMLAASL